MNTMLNLGSSSVLATELHLLALDSVLYISNTKHSQKSFEYRLSTESEVGSLKAIPLILAPNYFLKIVLF